MKRFFPLFFCLMILSFPLSAQIFFASADSGWNLSVEPHIGITWGKLGEYLYMETGKNHWKKNSYLEWEEQPLWVYGLGISGGYKRFGLNAFADTALPLRSGRMYDSDWKIDSQPDVKTNYSIHEETIAQYINASVQAHVDFYPTDRIIISPVAEAQYAYKTFEARNGYGWYGETVAWNAPGVITYPGDYDGKHYILGALDYRIHSFHAFAGFRVIFKETDRIRTEFSLAVAPYTYAYAEDRHYTNKKRTTGRYYVDKQQSHFDRYKGSAAVFYRLNNWLELGLSCGLLIGDVVKGDMYDEDPDSKKIYRSYGYKSGFSVYEASAKLSAKVRIF